jgi:hypothetical protein
MKDLSPLSAGELAVLANIGQLLANIGQLTFVNPVTRCRSIAKEMFLGGRGKRPHCEQNIGQYADRVDTVQQARRASCRSARVLP